MTLSINKYVTCTHNAQIRQVSFLKMLPGGDNGRTVSRLVDEAIPLDHPRRFASREIHGMTATTQQYTRSSYYYNDVYILRNVIIKWTSLRFPKICTPPVVFDRFHCLRNRSAPAVNCSVIIHYLEVSCKEDQIRSAQRE